MFDPHPTPQSRVARTTLVLGAVFTAIGALLVGLGVVQLAAFWNRTLSGLTIEPIVFPVGAIFLAFGVPKLLAERRRRVVLAHGVTAPAEVLDVTDTREIVDRRHPVVRVRLRVLPEGAPPFETETRMAAGAMGLQPGRRVQVRYVPGDRAAVVML